MPQALRYVEARQQAGGFGGAGLARYAKIQQWLHHYLERRDARDDP